MKHVSDLKQLELSSKFVRVIDSSSIHFGKIAFVESHTSKGVQCREKHNLKAALSLVKEEIVEHLGHLKDPAKPKTKMLTKDEQIDLGTRFGEFRKSNGTCSIPQLGPLDLLTNEHLQLLDWYIQRDRNNPLGVKFVSPIPIWQITEIASDPNPADKSNEELSGRINIFEKCMAVIRRSINRFGLIGLPIFGKKPDHWTLLILRRSGDEFVIRFYDSLKPSSQDCYRRAQLLIDQINKESKIQYKVPATVPFDKANGVHQVDGHSCGLFCMYFWAGEINQFMGCGWGQGHPQSKEGPLKALKDSCNFVVQKIPAAKLLVDQELVETKNKISALKNNNSQSGVNLQHKIDKLTNLKDLKDRIIDSISTAIQLADLKKADLQQIAQDDLYKGLKIFFGCSRCRWSSDGCISWTCNPDRYKWHRSKFPEKYEKDSNVPIDWHKISLLELKGGGGEQVHHPRCVGTLLKYKQNS